jgi:MerR, DNA binding
MRPVVAVLLAFACRGRTAQRAGLNLDEIRPLLEAFADNAAAIERLREVGEGKLPELETLIERAELVRPWLEDAACCTCPTLGDCRSSTTKIGFRSASARSAESRPGCLMDRGFGPDQLGSALPCLGG